jgi:hypothetical protein
VGKPSVGLTTIRWNGVGLQSVALPRESRMQPL